MGQQSWHDLCGWQRPQFAANRPGHGLMQQMKRWMQMMMNENVENCSKEKCPVLRCPPSPSFFPFFFYPGKMHDNLNMEFVGNLYL